MQKLNRMQKVLLMYILLVSCLISINNNQTAAKDQQQQETLNNTKNPSSSDKVKAGIPDSTVPTPNVTCYRAAPAEQRPLTQQDIINQIKSLEKMYKEKQINQATYTQRKQDLNNLLKQNAGGSK